MAGRRKLDRPADARSIPGRICILLDKVWGGSQIAMAADLGLRPATISNVLNRRRAPGRLMMERLASHPRVNGEWLQTGKGTALRVEIDARCQMVPVASRLLPGPPAKYATELTRGTFPVPASDFHPSMYFVVADHSICDEPDLAGFFHVGDKILFADPSRWLRDVESTVERLCTVKTGRGKFAQVHIRRVRCDRSENGSIRLRLVLRKTVPDTTPDKEEYHKPWMGIWLGEYPPAAAESPVDEHESQVTIPLTSIVAVAVMLIHKL